MISQALVERVPSQQIASQVEAPSFALARAELADIRALTREATMSTPGEDSMPIRAGATPVPTRQTRRIERPTQAID